MLNYTFVHPAVKFFVLFTILLLATSNVFSQTTAARPDRGTMPNGSYAVSDLENISLSNGNVNLTIPLASLPPMAGGKLSWTLNAYYNSKVWDVNRSQDIGQAFDGSQHYYTVDSVGASDRGGWRVTGQYAIQVRNAHLDFDYEMPPVGDGDYSLMVNYQWYKVVIVMPDGSEHELRPVDYSPFPGATEFLRGYYSQSPYAIGTMRYHSFDGSYLSATVTTESNWTVYLPDGTRVIQTADGIQRIQDTNGNKIKIFSDADGTHYQDELTLREIRYKYDPAGNNNHGQGRVSYKTVGGGDWLYIDINFNTTNVQGKLYRVDGWKPGQVSSQPCSYHVILNGAIQIVDEIVLPSAEPNVPGRRFTFDYNSETTESASNNVKLGSCVATSQTYTRQASKGWGSLSRMVTPTGAEILYSYEMDSPYALGHSVFTPDDIPAETITKKTIVQDGADDVWTYDIWPDLGASSQTYVNDNSVVSENSYPQNAQLGSGFGGGYYGVSGLTYRTTRPFQKVERHWNNLIFTGAYLNSPGGTVAFNPVVDAEYTTLTDAAGANLKMSAKTFTYDYNGNVTQTKEYDWFDPTLVSRDANGVPIAVPAGATLLRTTNNSYYNPATSASSGNVYAKRSGGVPLILNALQQKTLGPSTVELSYDGQAYGIAPTAGNLTTKKVWDDLDSKWITTSSTYDSYGNVATATDARGKITYFFYEDTTHALPTRIVVDPENGTGTQTTLKSYDPQTGVLLTTTDVNGQQTRIEYINQLTLQADPFGRPGVTKSPAVDIGGNPHQRLVKTTYLDSARQVIVATDLNAENDQLLKVRTTTDNLGRAILTEQTEDGTNYTISVQNAYLDMGRVTLRSSPMRATAASTDSWTRVTNDGAGRVIELATFGSAAQPAWSGTTGVYTGSITTVYDAQFTTVTDQAGKLRRSMVDGLGRTIRVDEPDNSNNLGTTSAPTQPTSYTYDVLGNLVTATQGAQQRSFTYDSLSRLRTAVNPESGTISYQYDDNGNLLVKTDARYDPNDVTKKVSTHFEYDALNRVTRRWYNGSSQVSAASHNTPSLPPGVELTNEAKFYYDTLPNIGGPSYTPGPVVGRLVAQTYGSGADGDYVAYDNLGRVTRKYQKMGTKEYRMIATYGLSGAINSMEYPSGHTVTYSYDQAGRLTTFSGNLGDGTSRTYSSSIVYAPAGSLVKEQFGMTTPVYNKLFYNSRGQLAEIRTSTSYTGPTDYDANRGGIINHYSLQCSGICSGSSMTDNNSNLKKQEILIPGETINRVQEYGYDSLNRLTSATEKISTTTQWSQAFTYDRWGNRTSTTASGAGLSNKQFAVNTANNRYGVPSGQSGAMDYDAAGNLTNDTYTGAGIRKYDAENKMTYAMGQNAQAQTYAYDAAGQRMKRTVNGVETWQIYGIGSELVAEYPSNGATANPQKEYGYRSGQLLITADGRTNVALSANGGVASASTAHTCCGFSVGGAINGNVRGPWGNGEGWNDATENVLPDWFQVDFAGSKTIDEIDVFSLHDNYTEQNTPSETQTFSLYGLINFQVQYWNGSAWATIPGGNVTGNNKVWRKFAFAPITTSKIRLWITGVPDAWSRLVELQAWAAESGATNLALNKPASQSTTDWGGLAPRGVDGNTDGNYANNSVTHTAFQTEPWWQVDLQSVQNIQNINVWNRTDCCGEALTNFYVFVSDNPFTANDVASTQNQPGVSSYYVAGQGGVPTTVGVNRTGRYVRVQLSVYERLSVAEVQVFGGGAIKQVRWLVSDQLGTPRIILDQTGTLATVKRHDYAPFGEDLVAVGGRSSLSAYSSGDGVRQRFTSKERDFETDLDYFLARYYSSNQGRFTSPDEFAGGPNELFVATGDSKKQALPYAEITLPQSLNKYTYGYSNPCRYIDPDGHCAAPSKLKTGEVGICVASYIKTTFVPPGVPPGRGDNRGTNGQGGTSRMEVRMTVDPKKGTVTKTDESVSRSGAFFKNLGPQGSGTSQVSSPNKDDKGNIYFQVNQNGASKVMGLVGNIENHLNMVVTPDGKVGITESSTAKDYPSLEVYKYTVDDKGKVTTTLIINKQESGNMLDLNKPEKPIKADPK